MLKIRGLRWWTIVLIMLGSIINYLTRSTLAVAAPTVLKDLHMPGFNPDPSILRVDSDYYIATSTFEWYPGVQIHHSRDLVHWRLLTRPLTRSSQLNMLGDPDSCGIWAPCLSYAEGLFYLIYTDVKRYGRTTQGAGAGASLRDTHNYLVTSPQIVGEWVEVDYERLHFAYRVDGQDWCWLPGQLDASILSDEAASPGSPNFTGAFVGMCCQDVAGTRRPADFDYFEYRERGYLADPRKVEAI